MAQTTVASGSAIVNKVYSVALFTETQKKPSFMRNMTGPAPKQSDAERKLKLQTAPDMPIVRVQDLAKQAGDTVSIDLVNITGGKPIMGDRDAEGRGEKLSFSSMDVKIDLATKVIDAGGKMSQQRTKHQLRTLALANATGYMARMESQLSHIHLAGARGDLNYQTWPIPLGADNATNGTADADFSEIVVNSVKAPTYNRHYVVNGDSVTKGGAQLASIATTDGLNLTVLDALRVILDEMELPLQPVKIADDPAANDDPMWVLLCPPRVFDNIKKDNSSALRTFQQNAWNRASYGSKHPLFMGEVGMWNGILVKKVTDFWVRFNAGNAYVKHITSANELTATETSVTIPALSGTHCVERSLLLGAQALANCYGRSQSSDFHYTWLERKYNFERAMEVGAECMGGKAKVRFNVPQPDGSLIPTDHGVIVLDSTVQL